MLRLVTAIVAAGLSLPVLAGEGGDIALRHLYAGTAPAGIAELGDRPDAESRFGKGLLQFAQAVQNLGQALYRHGYDLTDRVRGPMLIRIPINPAPEPIDYEKLRAVLASLVSDLDVAQATLLQAGVAGNYVIPVDVLKVAIDIDGNGVAGEGENIGAIIGPSLGVTSVPAGSAPAAGEPAAVVLGLDRADAIWMAGYANIVAAEAEFLLAHDFSPLLETLLPRLFPKAGLATDVLTEPTRPRGRYDYLNPNELGLIADLIAAIHTMDWPVVDRARLKSVQARLKVVTGLSRRNWQAILAETDNDHELLPGPKQSSVLGGPGITDEQVKAWLASLDIVDQMLDGKLLLPHWRFARGIDLNAYFSEATHTDPIMLLTGHDALPFLKDGPVMNDETFAAANRAFGWQWLGYAFWFN
ncbi:MAG: hypothetical protein J0I99_12620 [Devosia sp.]|uniref:hypothetical protein n=1 Tax=Devosia sp. TaxID=1871048 RepID=UPI001AC24255|nr:hypothetical protein [Devosia sp.]MBN9307714.1 hypothetical protein [Devosia sp.]MBN9316578.1 hypothetical protein [Devosia sp.]